MSRPQDWSPLTGSDPVPEDADAIRGLAGRYLTIASRLVEQARTLRTIGEADGWDADSGREFSRQAGDLGGALDKADERYRHTGQALNTYAGAVEDAQRTAEGLRQQALDVARQQRALEASPPPSASGDDPAAAAAAAEAARQRAEAQRRLAERLAQLQGQLRTVVSTLRAAEKAAVAAVKRAADDRVKDSTWDKVTAKVHSVAGVLTTLRDVLSVLTLVLSVALLFVPGVGWAAAAVLWGSRAALALNVVLASSGDASLVDVALSAVGVGIAARITRHARTLRLGNRTATPVAATSAAKTEAARVRGEISTRRAALRATLEKQGLSKAQINSRLAKFDRQNRSKVTTASGQARQRVHTAAQRTTRPSDRVLHLDDAVAAPVRHAKELAALAPNSDEVVRNAQRAEDAARRVRALAATDLGLQVPTAPGVDVAARSNEVLDHKRSVTDLTRREYGYL